MALTAEQILSADDLPRVRVDVPEWAPQGTDPKDSFVFVRRMTGLEMDEYDDALQRKNDGNDHLRDRLGLRATAVALATCDENGKRIFTSAQIDALSQKSAEPLNRLFSNVSDMNGLGKKSAEELEKN